MPWLSLPEYARSTGTPESTVRAAIRAGKLRAELEQRAPGDPRVVWRVWVDDPPEASVEASSAHPQPSTAQESDQPQSPTTDPPAAVSGLLELIEADRETIAEKDRLLAELHERIAVLREEKGRAETEAAMLRTELERVRASWPERVRRWWRGE